MLKTLKNKNMKKFTLIAAIASAVFIMTSCSNKISTNSKNSITFPGMTVSRADYKLSKDVSAEVEVKEWSTLLGFLHPKPKVIGENKRELRQGYVSGYGLGQAAQIAVYRLLDANPNFDYLTNIRVTKEYTKKWLVLLTKYNTKVKVVAKGITLNTEK
jgi:hypothetical protein